MPLEFLRSGKVMSTMNSSQKNCLRWIAVNPREMARYIKVSMKTILTHIRCGSFIYGVVGIYFVCPYYPRPTLWYEDLFYIGSLFRKPFERYLKYISQHISKDISRYIQDEEQSDL